MLQATTQLEQLMKVRATNGNNRVPSPFNYSKKHFPVIVEVGKSSLVAEFDAIKELNALRLEIRLKDVRDFKSAQYNAIFAPFKNRCIQPTTINHKPFVVRVMNNPTV
tara:strand:- start:183 stop:506 length:324 start_codon:yes stop_codon:yes gene_type:complete